ncbi:MAG: metal ABC transporter permease [Spirochaetales bacterium]|nr:metal ABC transporter permease [Spirochaetales bacterium]
MVEWILEPLQFGFFQRGLLAGIIVAVSCGILSGFIVWRGMAFIGDALAHAVLPGIVISIVLGIHVLIGALAAAVLSVLGIATLTQHKGFKEDTAIGVIFSGAFALGILLMTRVASYKDLSHILFGNILGVSNLDVILISVVGVLVMIGVFIFYKELLVTSFDPTHAKAIGLNPQMIHFALLVLVAATTVLATQTVGVVLVMALLVTPAATASLLVRKLKWIIALSIVFASASILCGFYLSYYYDLASGATIVLVLTGMFIICFILSRFRSR